MTDWDPDPEALAPAVVLPPREPLLPGFALRLADRRGVSARANFPQDEFYREPFVAETDVVLTIVLPLDIALHALHGGVLVFDFSGNASFCGGEAPSFSAATDKAWRAANDARKALVARRARYINAFLATLYVGGQRAGAGLGPQATVHLGNFQTAEIVDGAWRAYGPGAAPPMGGWQPVSNYLPGDVFRNAVETFAAVHRTFGDDTFELLPLLQDCAAHYHHQQFSAALVVGWSVAEALLACRWRAYVAAAASASGSHTNVTKERRNRLEGRDFTASVITETLLLAGKLDERHRETLDVARRARNRFAHDLAPCDPQQAFLAASVAAQMIGEDADTDFRVGSGYSFQL